MPARRTITPDIIPCKLLPATRERIEQYADDLRDAAHGIGTHGLSETEFLDSALFHAAIERLRGQQAAFMTTKRAFIKAVLDHMQASGDIEAWTNTGNDDRHDYQITMPDGRISVIEAKGCLDGNNTNIFERPANADEFIIWSLCQNPGANPNKNAWSGIQTRLSAEIMSRGQRVDGLIIWDMLCGTIGRPCPKTVANPERAVQFANRSTPPPCIYLFPRSIPDARNNPRPPVHALAQVAFIQALYTRFNCDVNDVTGVAIEARAVGPELERRSLFTRANSEEIASEWTTIRRAR